MDSSSDDDESIKLENNSHAGLSRDRSSTLLLPVQKADISGRGTYMQACKVLKVTPVQHFVRCITQEKVVLSHRGLSALEIQAITIAMLKNTFITKIDLKDNALGEEGIRYLSAIFEQNYFLADLNIAENDIGSKGAKYVARMLTISSTLKNLDLSGNGIGDQGIKLIVAALDSNYTLETLSLASNKVTENSAISIREALNANVRLKHLDISWNELRSVGAREISKALLSNGSLQELNISWNGLADKGAIAVFKALEANTSSIVTLNVTSNRITDKGAEAILRMIAQNETLESLDITMNTISKSTLIKILKQRMKTNSSQLNKLMFRDSKMAIDADIATLSQNIISPNKPFELHLDHAKQKDQEQVSGWKQKHMEDLCERFLGFVRGHRIRMLDLFQRFGASGDLVLTVSKFSQGMEKMKKDIKMSDWEIQDLVQYFTSTDGYIYYSHLSSLPILQ